jgi:valyl-tRNA synthetase
MALFAVTDDYKKTILEGYKQIIAEQARCSEVRVRRSGASFSGEFSLENIATALAGDVEVMVPLDGLRDPNAERAEREKLEKELAKLVKDRDLLNKKHENPQFLSRAPAEVLEKDRARLAELNAAIIRIEAALLRLPPKKD